MEKEIIKFTGKVIECLPNATFKVQVDNHKILSTISGKIRKFNINIMLGDTVDIEITPYDLSRGRIVYRHK
jgi:translation initiation factor IF-1